MGWFKRNGDKGGTQAAPAPQPAAQRPAPPPEGVEMIGFKRDANDVQVREADRKACPSCNGNDLEIFEDGSFICMACEYVSGGLAKEAVDSEMKTNGTPPGPAPVAAQAEMPAPATGGYQMGVGAPKISTAESLGRLDRIEDDLGDMSAKVAKHEDMYNRIYSDTEEMKNKFARIEASTLELQGLYDSVSMLFNPFIEVNADLIREFIDVIKTLDPEVLRSLTKEDLGSRDEKLGDLFAGEGAQAPPEPPKVPTCPTCGQMMSAPGAEHVHAPPPPKIILDSIPGDVTSSMISVQWMNFMIERVGPDNVPTLLEFYRKLNWIGQDVKTSMLLQMKGMRYDAKTVRDDWKMEPRDHLKSLIYIHKIKGTELDRDALEKMEKDIQDV